MRLRIVKVIRIHPEGTMTIGTKLKRRLRCFSLDQHRLRAEQLAWLKKTLHGIKIPLKMRQSVEMLLFQTSNLNYSLSFSEYENVLLGLWLFQFNIKYLLCGERERKKSPVVKLN